METSCLSSLSRISLEPASPKPNGSPRDHDVDQTYGRITGDQKSARSQEKYLWGSTIPHDHAAKNPNVRSHSRPDILCTGRLQRGVRTCEGCANPGPPETEKSGSLAGHDANPAPSEPEKILSIASAWICPRARTREICPADTGLPSSFRRKDVKKIFRDE